MVHSLQKEKLSRREQRYRERVNQEVQSVISQLSDQFLNFLLSSENPEGQEVVEKMKDINAKWRVYCKRKNLIVKAYPVMELQMAQMAKEYLEEKNRDLGRANDNITE